MTATRDATWFEAQLRDERRREREAVEGFVGGVRNEDMSSVIRAVNALDQNAIAWRRALRLVVPLPKPSTRFQLLFRDHVWCEASDAIRQNAMNDLLIADAARVLLPAYRGPALQIYRGSSFADRRRRSYGCSWSRSANIARQFAVNMSSRYRDGTALLAAKAPPRAIVHVVSAKAPRGIEQEVIVDRRWLRDVCVVERFPFTNQ